MLHHDRALSDATTGHNVSDTDFDDVTTAKLAINCQIEKRSVAQAPVMIEPETCRPNLPGLQRAFGSQRSPFIPRAQFIECRIR